MQAIEILCPTMKSDCNKLENADLDYSLHDIYVEFVEKEKQIKELAAQVDKLNVERENTQCKFSKRKIKSYVKKIVRYQYSERKR